MWLITAGGILAAWLLGWWTVLFWSVYLFISFYVSVIEVRQGRAGRRNFAHVMLQPFTLSDTSSLVLWLGTAAALSLR